MKQIHLSLPSVLTKLFADSVAIKVPLAIFGALAGYCFPTEAMQRAVMGLCGLILLDTVTGVVASAKSGRAVSSAKFSRVLVKILAYFSVVLVASICSKSIPGLEALQGFLVTGVLTWAVATEGISVLENVNAMGFVVPFGLDHWLKDRLHEAGTAAAARVDRERETINP